MQWLRKCILNNLFREHPTDAVVQLVVSNNFMVFEHMDKQNSLLYGRQLLNVQQAMYLFSTTFIIGTKSGRDVIIMLLPLITWKIFHEYFDDATETNTTI